MSFLADIITQELIGLSSVLFFLCFLIWEIPRSVKVMDEEYTQGVYPELGRVFDIVIFVIGLIAIILFYLNMDDIIDAVTMPTFSLAYTIIFFAIPILIFLGFLQRSLKRINDQQSVTVFLVHGFLDLSHTIFFITFSIILVPLVVFFVVDFVF